MRHPCCPGTTVRRSRRLAAALLVLPTLGAAQERGEETPAQLAELIRRVEDHHRSLPHFTARFEQRFTPRIFGRERIETGRLTVRNPGRMRWDYEDPEPKVFVTDGENTWFHVPADRQVVVGSFGESADPAGAVEGTSSGNPLRFLTGEADILEHFDAFLAGTPPEPDRIALRLVPHEPGEITSLRIEVDDPTGRIHAIVSEDPEGNRTDFRFSDFTTGAVPEDSLFRFTIPPGTEVVTASDLRP